MKKIYLILFGLFIYGACGNAFPEIRTGDIIFHASHSAQSAAIKLATHSKYTHLGIIVRKGGKLVVFHAVNPVRFTPLSEWIKDGDGGHYIIKRPRRAIGKGDIAAIEAVMKWMNGRPYDKYFGWGDDKIYCSELVWKIYRTAMNYELCGLRKMRDFDLTSPLVKKMMKERYGDKIPLNEPVVAPSDIFMSKELRLVEEK